MTYRGWGVGRAVYFRLLDGFFCMDNLTLRCSMDDFQVMKSIVGGAKSWLAAALTTRN